MRKGTKILIFTGLGILLAGIAICVTVLAVNRFRLPLPIRTDDKYVIEAMEEIEEEITEDFDKLTVKVVSADVVIQRSPDSRCRIQYNDNKSFPLFETDVDDNTLKFEEVVERDSFDWRHPEKIFEYIGKRWENPVGDIMQVVIWLPEKKYSSIEVKTVSGEIYIADIGVSAELDVKTVSGDIYLKKAVMRTGSIKSVSGDIGLDNVFADQMKIETTSGDVEGRIGSEYKVRASSVSGDINVPSGTKGDWSISTTSGNIDLKAAD